MNDLWFKEDREEAQRDGTDLRKLKKESEKALKNSTMMQRRLRRILTEQLEQSFRDDEDFSQPNWELNNVANISRRKTLREIIQLIDFK